MKRRRHKAKPDPNGHCWLLEGQHSRAQAAQEDCGDTDGLDFDIPWALVILEGPFQLRTFCDSVILRSTLAQKSSSKEDGQGQLRNPLDYHTANTHRGRAGDQPGCENRTASQSPENLTEKTTLYPKASPFHTSMEKWA